MSINNSYFKKNNTLLFESHVNTGRNPITQLFYGDNNINQPFGYSRFIFGLNLKLLKEKLNDGTISPDCPDFYMNHTLKMTNSSYFDKDLLNTSNPDGTLRSTSFDLILFRVPFLNGDITTPQIWDEGVGYDFYDLKYTLQSDKNYSDRPSNWYQTTTIDKWGEPGTYNNLNKGSYPFSALTIIDVQHFQFGNENVEFDMTSEINDILNEALPEETTWGIAYLPEVELLTGTDNRYSVGFFTRHTQTFYEPFLETNYNDLIEDDRNNFSMGRANKLYLYVYEDGDFVNLDENPFVTIRDIGGDPITGLINLVSCRRTKGVYEITLPAFMGYKTPCQFTDTWSNLKLKGFLLPDVINEFTLYQLKKTIQIGTSTYDPSKFGFEYYGIMQNEKILDTDIRKVGVIVKEAYSTNKMLPNIDVTYRVYVREGKTEVIVQDWTNVNRTPNEYYFMFDTRDKIPNEYFIDIQVKMMGQLTTYKKQIQFQVVNSKLKYL